MDITILTLLWTTPLARSGPHASHAIAAVSPRGIRERLRYLSDGPIATAEIRAVAAACVGDIRRNHRAPITSRHPLSKTPRMYRRGWGQRWS